MYKAIFATSLLFPEQVTYYLSGCLYISLSERHKCSSMIVNFLSVCLTLALGAKWLCQLCLWCSLGLCSRTTWTALRRSYSNWISSHIPNCPV